MRDSIFTNILEQMDWLKQRKHARSFTDTNTNTHTHTHTHTLTLTYENGGDNSAATPPPPISDLQTLHISSLLQLQLQLYPSQSPSCHSSSQILHHSSTLLQLWSNPWGLSSIIYLFVLHFPMPLAKLFCWVFRLEQKGLLWGIFLTTSMSPGPTSMLLVLLYITSLCLVN